MQKTKQARRLWIISTTGAGIWFASYLINGGAWRLVGMAASLVLVVIASVQLARGRRP
jgi:hypothetical protein